MARRFSTDIDLLGFALLNAMLNPISTDPTPLSTGQAGRVWYNSTDKTLKFWTGTAVIDLLNRSTHTGTQLANTISNLSSTVQGYPLNSFAAPTGDVSLASHKLTNVTDPSGNQDAATKSYVDTQLAGVTSGQILKGSVKVAVTTNLPLATPGATIDGVTMTNGDIVLLTAQTTASQNGPYVWSGPTTALARADNWNDNEEAVVGSYWIVDEGSKADNFVRLTNDGSITLDTTPLTFAFIGRDSFTEGNGIDITAGVISAIAAAGVTVTGSGIGADFAVVGRKVTGVIPAASSGIFSVSGSTVIVNHGLNNRAPRVTVRAYTSPAAGYTAGQMVEVDDPAGDENNVTLTLPAAPDNNNWFVSIIG